MTSTSTKTKRVLIILSDADHFPLKKSDGKVIDQPSGFFLMELAKPLQRLLDAGYEVTFASPEGKEPVPDPNSETLAAFAGNFYERRRENDLLDRMKRENGFKTPRRFADMGDDELKSYAGLLIPGGHAPLTDLGANKELGRILWHFHGGKKPTAVICHGPFAFLSTKLTDKGFAYKGYKVTSWSDVEESVMEVVMQGEIPKLESILREEGVDMQEGLGEKIGAITVDREVVSGGNPMAAAALGDKMIEMMESA